MYELYCFGQYFRVVGMLVEEYIFEEIIADVLIGTHIFQYALTVIIFVQADHHVTFQVTIHFGIAKPISAVPSFHAAVVAVGIQVNAINRLFFRPADSFKDGIGVVVPASDNDRYFAMFHDLLDHGSYSIIYIPYSI